MCRLTSHQIYTLYDAVSIRDPNFALVFLGGKGTVSNFIFVLCLFTWIVTVALIINKNIIYIAF